MDNENQIMAGGLPEQIEVKEARVMPIPKTAKQIIIDIIRKNVPWEKILDSAIKETYKGAKEIKDSTNSFMYKSTTPSENLIDEAIAENFRKFGK